MELEISNIPFGNIKGFVILIFLMLIMNFSCLFKLEDFQYYEMTSGMVLIVIFFGIFRLIMTLDFTAINDALLFGTMFGLWYYIVKKITNSINSDANGVIKF
jgi:hypothetical protein